jgi:hypothetical protein
MPKPANNWRLVNTKEGHLGAQTTRGLGHHLAQLTTAYNA